MPQPADIERSHRWREQSHEQSPVRLPNEPSADGRQHSQKRSRSSSSERSTSWSPSGRKYSPTRETSDSGHRRTSRTRRNSQSPCLTYKRRQTADSGHIDRQNYLADASQTPVASSSNERGKETPIFSMKRDVKWKQKVDEMEMTTSLTGGPDSEILGSNLGQPPVVTEKDDELDDRVRNRKPIKNFRMPRNRTLLDSVKAHLAVPGESAQQNRADRSSTSPSRCQTADLVPSLLTRLPDPPANSTKARNTSGDCQQNAGEPDKDGQNESLLTRHPGQNLSHHDIDKSTNTRTFGRQQRRHPSSSRSQDTAQAGPNYSTTIEKEPSTSSKNNYVSTNVISQPPISASPTLCQNSVATLTTVERNTMAISSYRCIPSRSVASTAQKQVHNDKPPKQFHNQQIPHVQPPPCLSIDAVGPLNFPNQSRPLAHSTSLNSVDSRTRLLARLEIEKRQVVQRSTTDNNGSPQPIDDGPPWSSSIGSKKGLPFDSDALKQHEREPDVLNLASDPLVSEESRKSESKLRARAQLRVRLAAEKRLVG